MSDASLDIAEDMARVGLIPTSIEVFGGQAELDDEIAREILRFNLTPLLSPQPQKGSLIIAHDYAGVRAANEVAPTFSLTAYSTHG